MQLARSGDKTLAYYTLASIFSDIYLNWDECHLVTAEVRKMEDRIVPRCAACWSQLRMGRSR